MKVITSKKKDVVPLKRKRGVLRKRMRVLMIEMLMSHKSFMRYSVVFLFPLNNIKVKSFLEISLKSLNLTQIIFHFQGGGGACPMREYNKNNFIFGRGFSYEEGV